jgi:XTP/dITP diphosphohydrolase
VYSARFAALDSGPAGNSSTAANNCKLLSLLENVPLEKRTARFRCVLALTRLHHSNATTPEFVAAKASDLHIELFEGACEGLIGFEPRGHGGFGYDPLFIPQGHNQTFAELGEETKNKLSHRARALEKLKQRLAS